MEAQDLRPGMYFVAVGLPGVVWRRPIGSFERPRGRVFVRGKDGERHWIPAQTHVVIVSMPSWWKVDEEPRKRA